MPNQPEVMFFLPHLGGGGAEMNAVRVSLYLKQYGFTPSFAVCRGNGSYERFLPKTTKVHTLDTGHINSSTLRLIRGIRPLRKLVEEKSPAILCPVLYLPSLVALMATRKMARKPKVVLSIQNSLEAKLLYKKGLGLRSKVEFSLIKQFYPNADLVISLSQGVAKEVNELIPNLKNKTTVIHNAGKVSTEEHDQELNDSPIISKPFNIKIIVACGRLVEQKGYPYLLKAFAEILNKQHAHLWILGEGPMKKTLLNLSQDLKISDHIKFLGFQNNPQLYMQMADVFVLSSLWEGFGNVIIEAMAMGTPVVATNCPHGPSEIIDNEINGILVPPADEIALANAIYRVLTNDTLRNTLSLRGLERSNDFTANKIAQKYADVFSNLLTE